MTDNLFAGAVKVSAPGRRKRTIDPQYDAFLDSLLALGDGEALAIQLPVTVYTLAIREVERAARAKDAGTNITFEKDAAGNPIVSDGMVAVKFVAWKRERKAFRTQLPAPGAHGESAAASPVKAVPAVKGVPRKA